DIALGNVVGSNIANILLILGVSAVMGGVACGNREIKRDVLAVAAASALLAGFSFTHDISWLAGGAMLALLTGYLTWCYTHERKSQEQAALGEHIEEELAADGP